MPPSRTAQLLVERTWIEMQRHGPQRVATRADPFAVREMERVIVLAVGVFENVPLAVAAPKMALGMRLAEFCQHLVHGRTTRLTDVVVERADRLTRNRVPCRQL